MTRRVLTFISIATVLLALCLQSSANGSATWWSEGSTFGYTYTGPVPPLPGAEATPVVWVALLQADLYSVAYFPPAAVSDGTSAGTVLSINRAATTASAGGFGTSYSGWWVEQGVS